MATAPPRGTAVGGTVTGLAGDGLVLQNNGSDDLAVASNSAFWFAKRLTSGASYDVTVATQPSNPTQTCTVSGGSGTAGSADVASVVVNCASNAYSLGGTVSGLTGTVVLENSNGDRATVSANGTFAFPKTLVSGASYRVTVASQPASPAQDCVLMGASGTVMGADVSSVDVTCSTDMFPITGVMGHLPTGSSIVLSNNGTERLTLNTSGGFSFPTELASGSSYDVEIVTQPAGALRPCTVANGSGTVGASTVDVTVSCCNTDVLYLGGTNTANDDLLVNALNASGMNVTYVSNGAATYANSPAASSFGSIIISPDTNYSTDMPAAGQSSIVAANEAAQGAGVVTTEWFAYNISTGIYQTLAPVQLLTRSGGVTQTLGYAETVSHPIWTGLPSTFTSPTVGANSGSTIVNGGEVIATWGSTNAAVVVRDSASAGRIVEHAHAAGYTGTPYTDSNMLTMMVNSVRWAAYCE